MSGDDITKRMYNGVDFRTGWPVIPYTKPTGTVLVKKPWWRRLLGL